MVPIGEENILKTEPISFDQISHMVKKIDEWPPLARNIIIPDLVETTLFYAFRMSFSESCAGMEHVGGIELLVQPLKCSRLRGLPHRLVCQPQAHNQNTCCKSYDPRSQYSRFVSQMIPGKPLNWRWPNEEELRARPPPATRRATPCSTISEPHPSANSIRPCTYGYGVRDRPSPTPLTRRPAVQPISCPRHPRTQHR